MAIGTSSVFLVYAHDNTRREANSQLVVQLIHWLRHVKVNVLSDQTPLGHQILADGSQDDRSRRDILWNQLRVLPRCRYEESADIVLLCCSKLLKEYYDRYTTGSQSRIYDAKIEEAYRRSQKHCMLKEQMYNEIHQVILDESSDDFHHALTELALLKARKANRETHEDESDSVIPVLVNGEYGEYSDLPFCANPTMVVCKFKSDGLNLLESTRKEHKLLFDILIRLSSPDYDDMIRRLSSCYSDHAEKLIRAAKRIVSEQEQSDLKIERQQTIEQARDRVKDERTRFEDKNRGLCLSLCCLV